MLAATRTRDPPWPAVKVLVCVAPDMLRTVAVGLSPHKTIAIMRNDIYSSLQKRGVPMRVIAQDPRRVIVANDVQ